jgi:hypothetical protein
MAFQPRRSHSSDTRHFKKVCGESGDVCTASVARWAAKLYSIIDGYNPYIANGGEMGFIFHTLSNRTLHLKCKRCVG